MVDLRQLIEALEAAVAQLQERPSVLAEKVAADDRFWVLTESRRRHPEGASPSVAPSDW